MFVPLPRHREVGFGVDKDLSLLPFPFCFETGPLCSPHLERAVTANAILDSSQMNPCSWPEGKVVQAISKVFLNHFSPGNDNTGSIMIKMTFLGL